MFSELVDYEKFIRMREALQFYLGNGIKNCTTYDIENIRTYL